MHEVQIHAYTYVHRVSDRTFFYWGGGGGRGDERIEGRSNCCTLKFTPNKNYHKVTELTTSATKGHAPDGKHILRKV